jgi:hypothetical protein
MAKRSGTWSAYHNLQVKTKTLYPVVDTTTYGQLGIAPHFNSTIPFVAYDKRFVSQAIYEADCSSVFNHLGTRQTWSITEIQIVQRSAEGSSQM